MAGDPSAEVAGTGVAVPVAAVVGEGESAVGAGAGEVGTVVAGAVAVGAVVVGAVVIVGCDGVAVVVSGTGEGCGELGAVAASPSSPCSSPPTPGSCVLPETCTPGSSEPDPPSAWDAGTPAVRTSTAPIAAAALPRRTPPWIPVRERKISDLYLTIVINPSDAGG